MERTRSIIDCDLRQLNLMLISIQDFTDNKIPLYTLQANFEFLLSVLEVSDSAWKRTVFDILFSFEMISADSATKGMPFEEALLHNSPHIKFEIACK